ncbi:Cationic amino acid transporter 4 [Cichlidogyrus casuarinus]|uniref:Cationic amino acid transporter 4 n=1 Tax=Cichlidogyrus casuarinus TaxID=1844966 RepID=A0ABD2QBD2_9PLAT
MKDHGDSDLQCSCSYYGARVKERVSYTKPFCRKTHQTKLSRCLSTLDLIGYGIAAMIGTSIFILTGTVMRDRAGPATFLSYLIAGIVALPNSLAYADLASRIPKAGSIYAYTYVLLNELIAFFAGWAVVLEYIIGTAAVARGISGTIDTITQGKMSTAFIATFGKLNQYQPLLADYWDPVGAALIVATAILSCFGIKSSAIFTRLLVALNLIVVITITIFMFVYADPTNINIEAPPNYTASDPMLAVAVDRSSSPFLPFGIPGLIAGAATCFNAFIGFDVISTCAEETKNPGKSLPRANIISVISVSIFLSTGSLALTLYSPWYLVTPDAPFHSALQLSVKGPENARTGMFYFISFGAIVGLVSCLLGNLIAASRILYGMAEDRLVFQILDKVCEPFKSPVFATILITIISAVLTLIFSIQSLADFLSLGTLFAYSLASVAVLKYRYCDPLDDDDGQEFKVQKTAPASHSFRSRIDSDKVGLKYSDSSSELEVRIFLALILLQSDVFINDFNERLYPYWVEKLPDRVLHTLCQRVQRGTIPMIALGAYIVSSSFFVMTLFVPNVGSLPYASVPRILFACIFAICMAISVFLLAIHRKKVTLDEEVYEVSYLFIHSNCEIQSCQWCL